MSHRSIVIFAWNGTERPFKHIIWDAIPDFTVLLFDYSGKSKAPELQEEQCIHEYLSIPTEFKGCLINEVYKYLACRNEFQYVGFFDDDLEIGISGINQLLRIAYTENFDAFQPATTSKSFTSHSFTHQLANIEWMPADWVEIMCPFYRKPVFDAAKEFYANCISSYGLDNYAIPFFQKLLGMDNTAVIHCVGVTHLKPVTNGDKVFSNGLRARQEGELIRTEILRRIKHNHPHLFDRSFLQRVYEYRVFRFNKYKRDIKRWLGYKTT